MYIILYMRPSSNSLGNDEPVLEMLLHTLEQTFQAGAVRSRRAYFFYILPFRSSCPFSLVVDMLILTVSLSLSLSCILHSTRGEETGDMRRAVDIDAICLFWFKTLKLIATHRDWGRRRHLVWPLDIILQRPFPIDTVCWLLYQLPQNVNSAADSAWQARSIDGAEGGPCYCARHSTLPPIRLLLLLLLLKLLHAVSAVGIPSRRAESLDGTWPQQAPCTPVLVHLVMLDLSCYSLVAQKYMGLSGSYGYM